MFNSCSNLWFLPELPATKLAEGCYEGMFKLCQHAMNYPDLPAKKLVKNCYKEMFCNAGIHGDWVIKIYLEEPYEDWGDSPMLWMLHGTPSLEEYGHFGTVYCKESAQIPHGVDYGYRGIPEYTRIIYF
jgi:hypothetical protein